MEGQLTGNGAAAFRCIISAAAMTVAFDTLKLADRVEAAGMPVQQAKGVAAALAETVTADLVTREYLDLRLGELRSEITGLGARIDGVETRIDGINTRMGGMATKTELAEAKAELLRWIIGAIGFQTVIIIGGVAGLIRLLH